MNDTKKRLPWFAFYADNFLSGTQDMSCEEAGAYIRLLCHQWTKGELPGNVNRIERLAGLPVSENGNCHPDAMAIAIPGPMASATLGHVLAKFTGRTESGGLVNEKLHQMRSAVVEKSQKLSANGKAGASARWSDGNCHAGAMANAMAIAIPGPMANGMRDTDTDTEHNTKPKRVVATSAKAPKAPRPQFVPPTREELDLAAAKLAMTPDQVDAFVGYYGSNGWMVGKNQMRSWQHALSGWAARDRQNNAHKPNPSSHAKPHRDDNIIGADAVYRRSEELAAHWKAVADSGETPF